MFYHCLQLVKACKDTNNSSKIFVISGIFSIFAIPKQLGDILAVVVKWYTRYFEGVVGASPCEFDSHLPHERQPDGFRRAAFGFR